MSHAQAETTGIAAGAPKWNRSRWRSVTISVRAVNARIETKPARAWRHVRLKMTSRRMNRLAQ
jgi:hypothetical protein